MKHKSLRINIAIIPPTKVARRSLDLGKKLRAKDTVFVLDQKHLPHLTVYMSNYPIDALPKIRKAFQKLRSLKPMRFKSPQLVSKKDGYVEIRYQRTKAMIALQNSILAALNPLRENIPAHVEGRHFLSSKDKLNLKTWGYPPVGQGYRPHLTVARFKKQKTLATLTSSALQEFSFEGSALGIYLAGEYDSAAKLLARRHLRVS